MDDRVTEILGGEEAWIVGGAVRDASARPAGDRPRRGLPRPARRRAPVRESVRRGAVPAVGAARRVAGRAGGVGRDRGLHAAAGRHRGRSRDPRLHAERDRGCRSAATATSTWTRTEGERISRRECCVRCRTASSTPTRFGSCERCGSRTSSGCAWTSGTEALLRAAVGRVGEPAGERDPRRAASPVRRRLSPAGRGRAARAARRLARWPARRVRRPGLPARRGLRRGREAVPDLARARGATRRRCSGRAGPTRGTARALHRFRRATEPWSLEALAFLGAEDLRGAVEEARRADPGEPLVRGDELGLPPGPEIGRILALIDEERAAGTISTREEALALARSLAGEEGARMSIELRLALQDERAPELAERVRRLLGPFTGRSRVARRRLRHGRARVRVRPARRRGGRGRHGRGVPGRGARAGSRERAVRRRRRDRAAVRLRGVRHRSHATAPPPRPASGARRLGARARHASRRAGVRHRPARVGRSAADARDGPVRARAGRVAPAVPPGGGHPRLPRRERPRPAQLGGQPRAGRPRAAARARGGSRGGAGAAAWRSCAGGSTTSRSAGTSRASPGRSRSRRSSSGCEPRATRQALRRSRPGSGSRRRSWQASTR